MIKNDIWNIQHNNSSQESVLIAQIIWYFIEGFHYRSNEYPFGSRENYIKYIVPMEEETLIFHKRTKRTGGGLRFHLFQMVIINQKKYVITLFLRRIFGSM
jgi:hypothetical protein